VPTEIPDKQYFRIGEVSRILGVKAHVLRYWESEFNVLQPQKSRTNHRLYRRRDVELLLLIKRLLYDEGYTISGANRRIRELARGRTKQTPESLETLEQVRRQVNRILELVEDD
jgi:DNA-binding transcriptional MerR regulator